MVISAVKLYRIPTIDICGATKTTEQHIPPLLEETGLSIIKRTCYLYRIIPIAELLVHGRGRVAGWPPMAG